MILTLFIQKKKLQPFSQLVEQNKVGKKSSSKRNFA